MNRIEQAFNNAEAVEDFDNHRNAPRPDPACLYGLVGDIARAGSETTEANPFAIAASAIAKGTSGASTRLDFISTVLSSILCFFSLHPAGN